MASLIVLSKIIEKETNGKNREIIGRDINQELEETSKALRAKLKAESESLGKEIKKIQAISLGTPLAFIDDPKERKLMHAKLQAFGACVRRGGGEAWIKGK